MSAAVYDVVADRVWDGVSDQPLRGWAVRVRASRIEAVRPVAELGTGVERVNFPGCTLVPGLIDAHVHYCESMGPAFLAAGVTSVRDVGNDLDWILRQRASNAEDPRRGPGLTCCGFLLDGAGGYWQHMARHHATAAALRDGVRAQVAAGVDQIKLYASLDLALLTAGVEEAHRHGKIALAHLGAVDAADAVRVGLNQIEHQTCCGPAWCDSTDEAKDQLIDLLLAHKAVLDPTLVVWDRVGRIYDPAFLHDERRTWVHPQQLQIWHRLTPVYFTPAQRGEFQVAVPRLKKFLARALARGVTVGLGTDTPFPHLVPGFSVHDELAMYVDAGIAPVVALRCATAVNARVVGRGDDVGRIAPGFAADLLAVEGDPTGDIRDIGKVAGVVHQGVWLDPQSLREAARRAQAIVSTDPVLLELEAYTAAREKEAGLPGAPSSVPGVIV